MPLAYTSYLRDSIDLSLRNRNTFTDLAKTVGTDYHNFAFSIVPDHSRLEEQAELFATRFIISGYLKSNFFDFANKSGDAKTLLKETYLYSYYKCVYHGIGQAYRFTNSLFIPDSSRAFYGHCVLFTLLRNVTSTSTAQHLTDMTEIRFSADSSLYAEIVELYSDSLDATGHFLIDKYETVLGFIERIDQSIVHSIPKFQSSIPQQESPLGNACFNNDMNNILYVDFINVKSDTNSFFWNTACCITLEKEKEIDVNDSVYRTIMSIEYDKRCLLFEVESITGLNFFNNYGHRNNNLDSGPNLDGGFDPIIPKEDFPKPSNPNPKRRGSKEWRVRKPNSNNDKKNQNKSTLIVRLLNKANEAKSFAFDLSKKIKRRDVDKILSVLSALPHFKLKEFNFEKFKDRTYKDIFSKFGLIDEEYAYLEGIDPDNNTTLYIAASSRNPKQISYESV